MITYHFGTEAIDWPALYALYDAVGLVGNLAAQKRYDEIRTAFERSFKVVTAWDDGCLIGAGRMVSDGICYASIFDVGVLPSHQGRGAGRGIMEALLDDARHLRTYLTSTFGKEGFYEKLGFRKHKTAYALLPGPSEYVA